MRQFRHRFLFEWMLMFLLLPPTMVWLDSKPGLADASAVLYDRILSRHQPTPSGNILIIGIDKRSMAELGPWPFARSVHAALLDRVAPQGPRAVLLDIFFDERSFDPAEDQRLAESMAKIPVYLPLNFPAALAAHSGKSPEFLPISPPLAAAARGVGHANATPDADGLVRGLWRYEGTSTRLWPYVGLLMAGLAPAAPPRVDPKAAQDWTRQGPFGIPFAGPAGTYPTISYVDALRGDLPNELLRDKLVLVGALSDAGLGDTLPVAGIGALTGLAGVEIHANALDALIRNFDIGKPSNVERVLWISLPIWVVLILFLRSSTDAVAITLAACGISIAASVAGLIYGRINFPMVSPVCGVVLAYLLWSWRRLHALLVFFRRRAAALNAVPAGAFEPLEQPELPALDSVERRTHALDRAIDRLTHLQSLLTEGVWELPIPVLICRADGIVSQSNAAAQALLAGSRMTLESNPEGSRDHLQGLDLPRYLEGLQRTDLPDAEVRDRPSPWVKATASEFTTKQGNIFRLRAASLGNRADSGTRGWVVVLPDVTAERKAQKEREQWFGFLSHDLRSPQVTILNLLTLFSEGAPNVNLRGLLEGVESEARRTIHLTESFMDMVEAESGVYRFALTFAGSIVLDAIDATWAAAQARNLTVKARLGSSDCSVVADSSLLTRALVNLLNNAIRSSASGTTIHVCLEANVDQDASQPQVVISVQDEGAGMTAEQLAKVMLSQSRRRQPSDPAKPLAAQGWGVGLSIVHAVVERHGGWVDVISAPGAGTTFFIGLPLSTEEPLIAESPS
ncbi:MAG: CHASE2 domain-containing protein [Gammaproteobacteria bacterium]|nr:CHASE2 domain-containing protein [Gammaproteobacteria bacterium]MBU1443180.1 CHASE2 domain-containing protein [Gammaproteobacteria bacterium]MBU2285953.1 CHASE2 domain-containing protein [Gammaproteobacteria bacterium]MBU2407588.1 CHASE2 domain-containing protein [Gammaproteobacteria bacterium]